MLDAQTHSLIELARRNVRCKDPVLGLLNYGFFNVRYGTENTGKRSVRTRTYGPYVRTSRFLAITRKRSLEMEN